MKASVVLIFLIEFLLFMKARYCVTSQDLHLFLNSQELIELEGEGGFVPILTAKDKEFTFWLRKYKFDLEGESVPYDGIQVTLPEGDSRDVWMISISEDAFRNLITQLEIGTRYLGASKLKILLDEDYH